MGINAKYVGSGDFYHGIPARDLTDADYRALTDEQRALVENGTLYEVVSVTSKKEE